VARDHDVAISYITGATPTRGPAAMRNAGWRIARGDVIAFTDDDAIPDRDWLRQGVLALGADAADAASGRIVVPLPDDPTDYERHVARLERSDFVTANCFCRRRVLECVRGFDARFRVACREDSDLLFKLIEYGFEVVYAINAVVVHPVRPRPGVRVCVPRPSRRSMRCCTRSILTSTTDSSGLTGHASTTQFSPR